MMAADRLSDWCDRKGLSQADLARALGVSRAAVCEWLSGKKMPELANALAIEKLTKRAVRASEWV
jgi:transcriptional regulator with XRE-family HTH domain